MNQPIFSKSLKSKAAYKLKFSGEAAESISELTMLHLHSKGIPQRAVRVYIIIKDTLPWEIGWLVGTVMNCQRKKESHSV